MCERFATSKLCVYDDLKSISTFGFRGEALASISFVSQVSIVTKTVESPCAFKAFYRDGKIMPQRPGDSPTPQPCAGVDGTTVTVQNLFYNLKTRRDAFKNNFEQINPHLPFDDCNELVKKDLVFGCAKPFELFLINNKYYVNKCEYK